MRCGPWIDAARRKPDMAGAGADVLLDEGWGRVRKAGPDQLLAQLDRNFGKDAAPFRNSEYMTVYGLVHRMCTQRSPHNYSENIYELRAEIIRAYLVGPVMAALRDKQGVFLLRELAKRWQHHSITVKWMKKFFL